MKSVVSEKGQVTIPKNIRDHLGLKPGSEIEFQAENGLLIGRKASSADPVTAVTGIVKRTIDVDRYLLELRGPVE